MQQLRNGYYQCAGVIKESLGLGNNSFSLHNFLTKTGYEIIEIEVLTTQCLHNETLYNAFLAIIVNRLSNQQF